MNILIPNRRSINVWAVSFIACLAFAAALEAAFQLAPSDSETFTALALTPMLPGMGLVSLIWLFSDVLLETGYWAERGIVVFGTAVAWSIPLSVIVVRWHPADVGGSLRNVLLRRTLKVVLAAACVAVGWYSWLIVFFAINAVHWLLGQPAMHEWGFMHTGLPLVTWPVGAVVLYLVFVRILRLNRRGRGAPKEENLRAR